MYDLLIAELSTNDTSVPSIIVAFRLTCAILLGAIVGWEREANSRAAGLRTHMMVSLAACLFAIIALELIGFGTEGDGRIKADPIHLIGAITSGVAFLAAGSIIVSGGKVRGLTTGASMWLVGAIGLACGTGRIILALQATIMALIVLYIINQFANRPEAKSGEETDDT